MSLMRMVLCSRSGNLPAFIDFVTWLEASGRVLKTHWKYHKRIECTAIIESLIAERLDDGEEILRWFSLHALSLLKTFCLTFSWPLHGP